MFQYRANASHLFLVSPGRIVDKTLSMPCVANAFSTVAHDQRIRRKSRGSTSPKSSCHSRKHARASGAF